MSLDWILILLPVAAASGWLAGRSFSAKKNSNQFAGLSRRYMTGLNYLLNEQPDKAIDTFIQLLEVDSETVETHLALGSLFRRRGEVDRALRLHQNIIARPALAGDLRQMAMFELGLDYLAAGVLDRAEHIFEDLKSSQHHGTVSLQQLLNIYQSTKDWERAITTAQQLQMQNHIDSRAACAHFYCELAELSINQNQLSTANKQLKQALKTDKKSVRVSFLQAKIAMQQQNWKEAIKYFRNLLNQDIDFFSEILPDLKSCFAAINDEKGYQKLLNEATESGAGSSVFLAMANSVRDAKGDKAAGEYITRHLRQHPSLKGLQALIELHLIYSSDTAKESLNILKDLVDDLIKSKSSYRCESCGLESKQLYWNCPSCKSWGSIKPILGLEGE